MFLEEFQKLDIPMNGVRLPSFKIEDDYKKQFNIEKEISNFDFLRAIALDGFNKLGFKKGTKEHKEYSERAKYELKTIEELGFTDYILLVWDVINFCKKNTIPTGYGRGSAAGSLVLYLIGVTRVDPIKFGLYFERFISKTRAKKQIVDGITYLDGSLMVDVDMDICYYNRHRVIDYLSSKFPSRTCKIMTLNTLSSKLLIKECGKIVANKTDEQMTAITELIPVLHGKVGDIKDAYKDVEQFKAWCDENKDVYEVALKLRDLNKNKGVHPSAMSISFGEMSDSCPTEMDSDKNEVSSYDMNWISLFNVKLDLLGLRSVSVVDDVCKQLNISMDDINPEDPFIYQNLQDLKTPHGIFQIEADTNYRVSQKVKPKKLEELSAVLALARPGALAWVDKYANYTNFQEYESIHPFFDEILKPTGGVAIYQEQLMKMAHKIGFTLDEAEILRRIVGKKKVEEVKEWQSKIENKVKENKLDSKVSEILWKVLEDSASYSFNASHSFCYGVLAAATIYLKFKHPQQFFLSLLKMTRFEPNPIKEISKIHKEMHHFGIKLLRPHIGKSNMNFTIEGSDIRFGLLSVKGISDKSIERLNKFRNEYSNKFEVFEAAFNADINIGILASLIQAGAFEGFKQSRTKVVYEAMLWNILTKKEKELVLHYSQEYNYDLVKIVLMLKEKNNEKGKPLIKPSRFETIKKKTSGYKRIFELNSKSESFANFWYEHTLLGFTYNKSLKDIFIQKCPDLLTIKEINELPDGAEVSLICIVEKNATTRTSKAGNKYMVFDCSDETGTANIKMFDNKRRGDKVSKLEFSIEMNDGKIPKADEIVIIKGTKKDGGCIFANEYAIQTNKIYTKLAQLKD
jgi:DNA polymerase-3 subunit alpha